MTMIVELHLSWFSIMCSNEGLRKHKGAVANPKAFTRSLGGTDQLLEDFSFVLKLLLLKRN